MAYFAHFMLCLFFLNLASCNKCDSCRAFMAAFRSSFHEIDIEQSLGGGNTAWEETFIGQYAFSELHFSETFDKTLKRLSDTDAHFLTDIDLYLEDFWLNNLKTGKSTIDNVDNDLCIEKFQLCCPWNTFGINCTFCDPCVVEHGNCDGNGTRGGSGICRCNLGYDGKNCSECNLLTHFQSISNNTSVWCAQCHPSCSGGCSDETPSSCKSCNTGFKAVENTDSVDCIDIDECASDRSPCKMGTFCINSEGSYSCVECPIGCSNCLNKTVCESCSSGYTLIDGKCVDIDECALPNACSEPYKRCVNRPGSYGCLCKDGYRLRQGSCVPTKSLKKASKQPSSPKIKPFGSFFTNLMQILLLMILLGILLYLTSLKTLTCVSFIILVAAFIYYRSYVLDVMYT